jgi:hypothetical protein
MYLRPGYLERGYKASNRARHPNQCRALPPQPLSPNPPGMTETPGCGDSAREIAEERQGRLPGVAGCRWKPWMTVGATWEGVDTPARGAEATTGPCSVCRPPLVLAGAIHRDGALPCRTRRHTAGTMPARHNHHSNLDASNHAEATWGVGIWDGRRRGEPHRW